MSVGKIEVELTSVDERIAELREQLKSLETWRGELETSLRVLTKLADSADVDRSPAAGGNAVHTSFVSTTAREISAAAPHRRRERGPSLATGLPLEAGNALKAMLHAKGEFIKPMDAVARLKAEHDIQIGLGRPGRETSDLSASLGHGRVPGLVVLRGLGYGLTEWNGKAPGMPRLSDQPALDDTAATAPPGLKDVWGQDA